MWAGDVRSLALFSALSLHDLALVSAHCTLFKHFSGGYQAPSESFQNDPLVLTAMCLENIGPRGFALAPTNPGDINDSWQTDKGVCLYLKAIRFYRKKAFTHTHTLLPGGFSRRNCIADIWQSELRKIPPIAFKSTSATLRGPTEADHTGGKVKKMEKDIVMPVSFQGLLGF